MKKSKDKNFGDTKYQTLREFLRCLKEKNFS